MIRDIGKPERTIIISKSWQKLVPDSLPSRKIINNKILNETEVIIEHVWLLTKRQLLDEIGIKVFDDIEAYIFDDIETYDYD